MGENANTARCLFAIVWAASERMCVLQCIDSLLLLAMLLRIGRMGRYWRAKAFIAFYSVLYHIALRNALNIVLGKELNLPIRALAIVLTAASEARCI